MTTTKLKKMLQEDMDQQNSNTQNFNFVVNLINSVLNNNKWNQNETLSVKQNINEIKKYLEDQINPYEWNDVQKDELKIFIIKLLSAIGDHKKLLHRFIELKKEQIQFYNILNIENMKQLVEKEVRRILSGVGNIQKLK